MSVSSTSNTALTNLSSGYESTTQKQAAANETLGREQFLTLLVAQLENQDPLSPQEGTDFTAQLAEYSQLEQLMNINDSMGGLSSSYQTGSQGDGMNLLGKQVTGYIESLEVSQGEITSGFYNLNSSADVLVDIYDSDGNKVKRLQIGQQTSGGKLIAWDGTDTSGNAVADGKYTYKVLANYGKGYEQVETSVTGTVDGVTYNNGTPYLVVQGVLVALDDVTAVSSLNSSDKTESIMDYLGRGVKTDAPIVLIENGEVAGEDLNFELDKAESVTVTIYDAYDEVVNTILVDADDLKEGSNTVHWNGLSSNGSQVSDGLYYYTVKTGTGTYAKTSEAGQVSAIKNVNSAQYLVLEDSGRLVALSTVKEIY